MAQGFLSWKVAKIAAAAGSLLLVAAGLGVRAFRSRRIDRDRQAVSLLVAAASTGRVETLRDLAHAGAEVDGRNAEGLTPLMAAAREGRTEAVRVLLALGANAGLKDGQGRSALQWAKRGKGSAAAAVLRGHFRSLNQALVSALQEEGRENFNSGQSYSRAGTVRALLERGASPDRDPDYDLAPLEATIAADDPAAARALLDAGADPNYRDAEMGGPLGFAVANNEAEIVRLLLQHGADVHARNMDGETVLQSAESPEMRRLLEAASGRTRP